MDYEPKISKESIQFSGVQKYPKMKNSHPFHFSCANNRAAAGEEGIGLTDRRSPEGERSKRSRLGDQQSHRAPPTRTDSSREKLQGIGMRRPKREEEEAAIEKLGWIYMMLKMCIKQSCGRRPTHMKNELGPFPITLI